VDGGYLKKSFYRNGFWAVQRLSAVTYVYLNPVAAPTGRDAASRLADQAS
jgi:hypothetical protein